MSPTVGAYRGFSYVAQKAPAMVPNSLPPATKTSDANVEPQRRSTRRNAAYIVQMQTYMGQRMAALEQLLAQMTLNQTDGQQQVMVKDVSMSFDAMVAFMVKWAIAAAAIILLALWAFLAMLFGPTLEVLLR